MTAADRYAQAARLRDDVEHARRPLPPDPDLGDYCTPDEDMRQAIDFAGYFWTIITGLLVTAPLIWWVMR